MVNKECTKKFLEEQANEILEAKKNMKEQLMEQVVNQIRWRFAEDKNKIDTNAKLVEWEDGSFGVYIGDQYFDIKDVVKDSEDLREASVLYSVSDKVMVGLGKVDFRGSLLPNLEKQKYSV